MGAGGFGAETQGHLASRGGEEVAGTDRDGMVFQNLGNRESKKQDSPFGVGSKKIKMHAGQVWL